MENRFGAGHPVHLPAPDTRPYRQHHQPNAQYTPARAPQNFPAQTTQHIPALPGLHPQAHAQLMQTPPFHQNLGTDFDENLFRRGPDHFARVAPEGGRGVGATGWVSRPRHLPVAEDGRVSPGTPTRVWPGNGGVHALMAPIRAGEEVRFTGPPVRTLQDSVNKVDRYVNARQPTFAGQPQLNARPGSQVPLPQGPHRSPISPPRNRHAQPARVTTPVAEPQAPAPARVPAPIPAAPLPTPAKTPAKAVAAATAATKEPRMTGKGSRSGEGRRRKGGKSDDEIAKLSEEQMKVAGIKVAEVKVDLGDEKVGSNRGLTEMDKVAAVTFITSAENWPNFRLQAHSIFILISSTILENRVTTEQVKNYWSLQAWPKYKAVRARQEHTGGGDGDEDRDEAHEGSDDGDDGGAGDVEDNTLTQKAGKRKRTNPKKAVFSRKVLDAFEVSKVFELIDAVAHNDESVIRHRDFNSADPMSRPTSESDDSDAAYRKRSKSKSKKKPQKKRKKHESESSTESDGPDGFTSAITRALQGLEAKNKRLAAVEKANLELARRREEREQLEFDQRREDARRREAVERRDARAKEWTSAMTMLSHANPLIQKQGEKMVARLTAEEEQENAHTV
ncbi:hypothetical protein BV25DRAFT_1921308 [Artomyces pyxidatus]|uniref:Uncharacterized protein n=1 Tax=Artomyces pyxidatus TaxID=48021 RepID=A0ACB8SIK1_9AGAM|nr:hypothetical protein BV25DRAFT_1921308 [Artomyces pyxidatus]